ncbi:MAG TPA: DUF1028 domain-containing protein [Streptosporangiaceae bacterium]|nr:DUF1028 domain-containing protein [Streptosporangiaceae bacterium]
MTYSIVARDPQTGLMGVAVQSAMFAVGSTVPWALAGVGAVATQAIAEPAYGTRCLDALQSGASAQAALDQAITADEAALLRQVGVVAADGGAAAMTGEWCIDQAGQLLGDGFAVQANMMSSPDVWPAMAEAYGAAARSALAADHDGVAWPFARRLLAVLEAGQAAGGDARGVMSAALVVVAAHAAEPWAGRLVDLRVDRSGDPLGELRRLLDAAEAYDAFGRAVDALGGGNAVAALAAADQGLALLPGEQNLRFIRGGALAASGDEEAGHAVLRALIDERPSWAVVARGFAAKGLLALPAWAAAPPQEP